MRKLKDKSGATILMALLVFLLATVVSALILTAATSASHHIRNDREAQQNYLTVSSAAELIRDEILEDSYSRTINKRYVKDIFGNETMTVDVSYDLYKGTLAPWLNGGIDGLNSEKDTVYVTGLTDTILIDVPVKNGEKLKTVKAKFKMDNTAESAATKIVVELSLNTDNAQDDCKMTLTLSGVKSDSRSSVTDDEYTRTEKVTTTVLWNSAKITKGAQGGAA